MASVLGTFHGSLRGVASVLGTFHCDVRRVAAHVCRSDCVRAVLTAYVPVRARAHVTPPLTLAPHSPLGSKKSKKVPREDAVRLVAASTNVQVQTAVVIWCSAAERPRLARGWSTPDRRLQQLG